MSHNAVLLVVTATAVVGLVLLIARGKVHAFIALLLASLFVGLCAGGNPPSVVRSFAEGAGSILGSIAFVIALGAVLGKTLAVSGGAECIALTIVRCFGQRWAHWAVALAAFLVGLPVFFSVGLVLLMPVVLTIAREAQAPPLRFALPLLAGLSVAHALAPPHPGPMAAVELLKADTARTILYALLVGLPTTMLCGPLLGAWLARQPTRGPVEPIAVRVLHQQDPFPVSKPSFPLALFTLLLPVLMMLGASAADLALPKDSAARHWGNLLGSPVVAMLAAVLFSFWSFGHARGFDSGQLGRFSEECLAPVGTILLVVGAGAGFSRVLIDSGVGEALLPAAKAVGVSPLLLGWLVTALIRVATGSATVAITTAAGILAPIANATTGLNRELLVVAMGAGSIFLSHVNDGGFWLVKEYLGLDVSQTLKTWTVLESAISVVALLLILPLSWFV